MMMNLLNKHVNCICNFMTIFTVYSYPHFLLVFLLFLHFIYFWCRLWCRIFNCFFFFFFVSFNFKTPSSFGLFTFCDRWWFILSPSFDEVQIQWVSMKFNVNLFEMLHTPNNDVDNEYASFLVPFLLLSPLFLCILTKKKSSQLVRWDFI